MYPCYLLSAVCCLLSASHCACGESTSSLHLCWRRTNVAYKFSITLWVVYTIWKLSLFHCCPQWCCRLFNIPSRSVCLSNEFLLKRTLPSLSKELMSQWTLVCFNEWLGCVFLVQTWRQTQTIISVLLTHGRCRPDADRGLGNITVFTSNRSVSASFLLPFFHTILLFFSFSLLCLKTNCGSRVSWILPDCSE